MPHEPIDSRESPADGALELEARVPVVRERAADLAAYAERGAGILGSPGRCRIAPGDGLLLSQRQHELPQVHDPASSRDENRALLADPRSDRHGEVAHLEARAKQFVPETRDPRFSPVKYRDFDLERRADVGRAIFLEARESSHVEVPQPAEVSFGGERPSERGGAVLRCPQVEA